MQLVQRTLDALLILSKESEGLSVSELATKLDIPNSSTHRILTCLKENHFVSQSDETKRYRISYKVLALASNIKKESAFTEAARPFMKELADKINKTVTLCIMESDNIVCLDYIESQDTGMFFVKIGFTMPPHATSAGKAMLAYLPIEKVKQIYFKNHDIQLTNYTKTNYTDFIRELETVQLQGYAISDEELQLGVQGIACPIFDYDRNVVGSVSFTAIKADNCLTAQNTDLLKECARKISNSIGGVVYNQHNH